MSLQPKTAVFQVEEIYQCYGASTLTWAKVIMLVVPCCNYLQVLVLV